MTETTDDQVAMEILNFFFPENPISEHQLNASSRNLAAKIYVSALESSNTMHLVPRPSYSKPTFVWLGLEAVKTLWRSEKDSKVYDSVKYTVARNFRSSYEMAKLGI